MTAPQRAEQVHARSRPPATVTSTPPDDAEVKSLQARVVGMLARADGPVSTSAVRDALHDNPSGPSGPIVVIERVYAALVALERKRVVQRVTVPKGNTRSRWQLRAHGPRPLRKEVTDHALQRH